MEEVQYSIESALHLLDPKVIIILEFCLNKMSSYQSKILSFYISVRK